MGEALAENVLMLRPTRVLLVEDDHSDAFLIRRGLEDGEPETFNVVHAENEAVAISALSQPPFDVCLLDLCLPDSTGLSAMLHLREKAPNMPVLILTALDDEELARQALAYGAQDYLLKDGANPSRIRRAITHAIERKRYEGNLAQLAHYDTLTNLANRRLFESRLNMALARAKRSGKGVAVFFIDLDRFKQVNDSFGHDAGDHMLKTIAQRFCESLRAYDTVARFGGDEFAVILEGVTTPRDCAAIAYKLLQEVTIPVSWMGVEIKVGLSIGIATSFAHAILEATTLMRHADTAMYRAKSQAGSRYCFYTLAMHAEAQARLQLEEELQAAVAGQHLLLYYQPRFEPGTGRITGAEALLRWEHPKRGLLTPGDFGAAAEALGLMPAIGQWTIATVCRDIKAWEDMDLPLLQVSINLSSQQLAEPHFIEWLESQIAEKKLRPQLLAFEVTEEVILHNPEETLVSLVRLQKLGVQLHLDKFGCGMASLHALRQAPLSMLKIDRSLVRKMGDDAKDAALIRSIIDMAHRFGLKVGAVGVETERQKEWLAEEHCDELQGFAVSRPMTAPHFSTWITQHPGERQESK